MQTMNEMGIGDNCMNGMQASCISCTADKVLRVQPVDSTA
jgi:hypothetical protein